MSRLAATAERAIDGFIGGKVEGSTLKIQG
jgi:hypothetical protein